MSVIKLYDTLQAKVREFIPLNPQEVTLYTCGPTVYNYAHIGNFRTFVFEDLLRRFLEFKGFKVKHVMNITDVDDKTIAGAVREKKSLEAYTQFYTEAFLEDLRSLHTLPPTVMPRATAEIPSMISMIQKLIGKGIAYVQEGSVYYRVAAFPGYGKLSKKKLEGNIAGARVDVDEYDKEEGADFVLWKAAKDGEPSWDSPWGKGRPGWHIECSAMSGRLLGDTVDIHAGGEDLVFPHHENEIAQSEAATGKPFVNYWLHAKHLMVNGEKMSKSKGNFFTLRDLLAKGYDPMAIRYALLSVHYRHSLNFTLEGLKEAKDAVEKLDNCYFQYLSKSCLGSTRVAIQKSLGDFPETVLNNEIARFLADDLNTAAAFAGLFEGVTHLNARLAQAGPQEVAQCLAFFEKLDSLFGFDVSAVKTIPEEVQTALRQYMEMRKEKNFSKSDALRKEIEKRGWLVKDGRPGELSTVKKIRRAWDIKK